MTFLIVENICKSFNGATALDRIHFSLGKSEFFTLLGPSGCGKTTLLRVIAGFEAPDAGRIVFNGRSLGGVAPHKRNISMVFQDYALFPHMNVYKNIAYGLKTRSGAEVRERTFQALEMVQLDGLEHRMPDQLSGGQQQRVALARALATQSPLILMDEPLSNLDAGLRLEMRAQIREIQKKAGIAILYVTHDQEEALAVSDRIAVLNRGAIVQIGPPSEIYTVPGDLFTATFVGEMNLFAGLTLRSRNGGIAADLCGTPIATRAVRPGSPVTLAIRPEEVVVVHDRHPEPAGSANSLAGVLKGVSFTGASARCFVQVGPKVVLADIAGRRAGVLKPSQTIRLHLPVEAVHLFDESNGQRIGP